MLAEHNLVIMSNNTSTTAPMGYFKGVSVDVIITPCLTVYFHVNVLVVKTTVKVHASAYYTWYPPPPPPTHTPAELSSVEECVGIPLSQWHATTAAGKALRVVHPGHAHRLRRDRERERVREGGESERGGEGEEGVSSESSVCTSTPIVMPFIKYTLCSTALTMDSIQHTHTLLHCTDHGNTHTLLHCNDHGNTHSAPLH